MTNLLNHKQRSPTALFKIAAQTLLLAALLMGMNNAQAQAPVVSFPTATATVVEGGEVAVNVAFTSSPLAARIFVNVRVEGTATSGADFNISNITANFTVSEGLITISAGRASPTAFFVRPLIDELEEVPETLTLTLLPHAVNGAFYTVGTNNTYTLTITDVPPAPPPPPPLTVVLTVDSTTITDRDFVVTMTTSKRLATFSTDDISIPNGQVQALGERIDHPDGTAAYPLHIRAVSPGIVEVTIREGFRPSADGIGPRSTVSNTLVVTYTPPDNTPPMVTLTGAPSEVTSLAAFAVTATFDEDVTGFDAIADITVTNGTAAVPAAISNSKTTYTLTITPDGNGAIGITIPAAAAIDDANNGNMISDTVTVAYATDTTPPVASIHIGTAGTQVGTIAEAGTTSTTVTVTLNPAPTTLVTVFLNRSGSATIATDYSQTGLSAAGDSLYGVTVLPGATTASFTLTAVDDSADDDDETAVFTVVTTGTGYTPASGGAAAVTVTIMDDDAPPEFSFQTATAGVDEGRTAFVNIAFTGPALVSITTLNIRVGGTAETTDYVVNAGDRAFPEFSSTPPVIRISGGTSPATVVITLATDALTEGDETLIITLLDGDGYTVGSANTYTLTITDVPPPLPVASVHIGTAGTQTGTIAEAGTTSTMVTVSLSAPAPTGGVVVSLTRSGMATIATDYSQTGLTDSTDPAYSIMVAAGTTTASFMLTAVADTETDPAETAVFTVTTGTGYTVATGGAATATVTILDDSDTTPPTVAMPVPEFSIVEQATSFEVTVTFSEPVTGFDAATDIMVTRGTTLAPVAMGDSGMVYILAITPAGPSGQIVITIPAGVAMDASGNLNTASPTLSVTYIRPVTVVLSLADPQFISNGRDPFAVTATFSEAVNFIMGDVMVANGTFTASGNGAVYTLTITPTGDTNDAITIQLLEGAGEVGASGLMLPRDSDASEVLQVMVMLDTTPPTVTLTGAPSEVTSLAAFAVTATFDEDVTGFDAIADITVTNGTAAVPAAISNSKTTYTLTITPDGNGAIGITIPAAAAMDDANNGNLISDTVTVAYTAPADTTRPTVTFSDFPASHDGMTPFTVTVTLSEPSNDFELTDIQVPSATETLSEGMNTDSGTVVYTLTVTPTTDQVILIATNANQFTDLSGNVNPSSNLATIPYAAPVVDAPMVSLRDAPATVSNLLPFEVLALFDEGVGGFDSVADIMVTNGTALAPMGFGSETDFTLTITPDGMGNIEIFIPAGAAIGANGNGNPMSNTVTVAYVPDITPPTVTFTAPASHNGTSTFTVAVALSETATDFVTGDIALSDNASGMLTGSGTDYTLTIIPANNNPITIDIAADSFTDAATNGNTAPETLTVTYDAMADTTPPTATFSGVPASHDGMTPFTLTITLSEVATDFAVGDFFTTLNVNIALSGSGTDYSLTVTPTSIGSIIISINPNVFTDASGNGNLQAATGFIPYVAPADTTPPTVELSGAPTTANASDTTFVVTATFSEAVTGFDAMADITVTGGTAIAPVAVGNSETTYTLTITPTTDGTITINIPADVAEDAASNDNTASNEVSVTYDGTPPTVFLSGNDRTISTLTFVSTFLGGALSSPDINYASFTLDEFVTTPANVMVTSAPGVFRPNTVYTFTHDGTADEIIITIPVGSYTDNAGNPNTEAFTFTTTYTAPADTTPPTAMFSGVPASHDGMTPFTLTITLSEPSTNFVEGDISATLDANIALSGSGTDYSLIVTPIGTGIIAITLNQNVFTDAANVGNLQASSGFIPYAAPADTTPPTVELTGAPTTANASDTTFAVTATFSEPVTGFDAIADIAVTNGTAIAPVAVGSSETAYTLTITPTTDGEVTITIPADVAVDAASNNNMASNEVSVTYDTTPPEISLTGSGRTTNTLTFVSTIVSGLVETSDINSASFTLDEFVTSPANVMITSAPSMAGLRIGNVLTITHDGTASEITITVPVGSFTDNAGNPNTEAFTLTFNYVDNTPPTVTLTGPNPATFSSTDAFVVTATFSEPVTGFDEVADITVTNGTATPVAVSNSETTYTLNITPDGSNLDIEIFIPADAAMDTATTPNGNTISDTLTVAYAASADTTPPTVARPVPEFSIVEQATSFEVTVTFSEPVTGFDAATDIMVTRGTTLAPVAMGDSGMVYTLAITPAGPSGQIVIIIPAGVAMDASGNLNTASPTLSVTYIRPVTVVLSLADPQFISNGRDPFEVTATFSGALGNFNVGDVMVANGTVTASGNGAVYTLTITPTGDTNDAITIQLLEGAGEVGGSGQILPQISDASEVLQVMVLLDTTPPTVELTGAPTTANASDTTFAVTATFSKAVTGFDVAADITVTGGTVAAPEPVGDSGTTYTLTITPGNTDGEITITIPANVAADDASNNNMASNTVTVTYDTTPPTVTYSGFPTSHDGMTPFMVTVTLSEVATDFVVSDITQTNANRTLSGSGTDYIVTVTPRNTNPIAIAILADSFTDAAGNGNISAFATPIPYVAPAGTTPVASVHIGTAGTQVGTIAEAGTTSTTVTVALNPAPTTSVTVNLTRSSTATIATDYSQTGLTDSTDPAYSIMVLAGATTASFMLTAVDDSVNDDGEAAVFTVTTGTGYTVAAGGTAAVTVTILDNDAPPVASIHIGTAGTQVGTIAEAGTTSTTVTVTLNPVSTTFVTVFLDRSGSATIATDYSQTGLGAAGGSRHIITLAAGATTGSFTLTAVDDSVNDDDETAVFTVVTTGTGYTPASGGAAAVTVTIMDDDSDTTPPGPVTGLAAMPGNGEVALSWTNPSDTDLSTVIISATVTADGTVVDINGAGAGNDLSISATAGSMGSQTITGLSNGTGYTFSLVASDGTNSSTAVTTTATPVVPIPEFSFPTATATGAEGGAAITVSIAFTGGALASNTNLNISLGGTAMAADYSTANGSAAYDAGSTTVGVFAGRTSPVTFVITPATDALTEGDETLVITLESGDGYTVDSANTYTLTITDVPPPPVASVHIGTAGTQTGTIAEAGTTSTTVTVALSAAAPPGEVTVLLTRSGSADIGAGNDYTAGGISGGGSAFRIIVAAGATTASFTLTAVADTETDPAETAVFTVVEGMGYTVAAGGAEAVTVTIMDDSDTTPPTVELTGPDPATFSSTDAFVVTATFSEAVTGFDEVADITVTNGTATPVAVSNSETTYTLNITPDGSNLDIEIFIPAAAAMDEADNPNTVSNTVTVAYTDTTPPTVRLTGAPTTANAGDTTFTVTATFSEPVTGLEAAEIDITNATVMLAGSGTTYTLTLSPTTPRRDGTITITIPANVAVDAASNGNTASSEVSVTYDATPPTVELTGPTTFTEGTFTVTATFSEAVTGLTVAEITITGASVTISGDGTTYTLTIVPDGTNGDIEISIPADVAADADTGYGNTASETFTVAYAAPADTTPPTVMLTSATTTVSGQNVFMVTATFSEDVTGFDSAADITVINGLAGNEYSNPPIPPASVNGSARVYTLTILSSGNGDVSISIPANVAMDGAGNGNTASAVFTVDMTGMDTARPRVQLTPSPDSSIGERGTARVYFRNSNAVFEVTATFNEPVRGFGLDDINIDGGTTSNLMGMDEGSVYTFDLTPSGTGIVRVAVSTLNTGITDLFGNALITSSLLRVGYDTTPPTVALSDYPATANASDTTFTVTATFSEAVPGFNADDITVDNGAVTVSGSGPIYTLTITPDGNDGPITIAIAAGVVTDVAGTANTASTNADSTTPSDPVSVTYDGTPPTVTLSGVPATVNVRDPFTVTATFSEAVTGFDAIADITVNGGTAMAPVAMGNDDTTYTLTITPANTDGTITIEIPAAAATDTTGNGNEASTSPESVTSDTTPPTVMLTGAPTTANASTTTFTVTATFDEAVTGFDAADITVGNGAVTVSGSGPIYTLTITPDGNDGEITIAIAAGVVTDVASNANTASTSPVSVTYDATAPTVALSDYPTTATSDTTFTVTATFSEAVPSFNAADITVTNGAVTVSGSGPIYTLTITPAGNDGEIMIGIAAGVVTDVAANANSLGSSVSVTYDTTAPTVTLTGPNPATFSSTEAFVVTATFNEPVTGFDAIADIMVTNGATTVPVAVGNSGTTYTLTITPVETTDDIEIFIPTAAAMDDADNPNAASETLTVAYTDTTPPAVRLQADFDVNEASSGFTVTVTFDEPVTGFDAIADITVTNATATAPMPMGDDGTTYTTTITPTDTLAPGVAVTIQISIAANVAIDATNNGNEASTTQSLTYTPPVGVTLSLPESQFISNGRDTFEVTATFTGELESFNVDDVMVANGTVTATGSGAIYTLTITPTGNNNDPITIEIAEGAGELENPEGALPLQSMASEVLQVMVLLDIIPPTVVLTAPAAATGMTAFTVTAIFDEPVTGFDAIADITVTNGTAVAPVAVGSSETDYTLTITPDGMGAITILIPADAAVDGASNGNTASATTSVTYTLEDTIAPTVLLSGAPDTVNSTATFAVTATFSEAVTGFDEAADITVTNGAATIAGSGTTYTLTITPDGTGNIGITIPAAAAVDGANNGNAASNPVSVTYDTTVPTVMLSGAPDTVNNNSFAVTATFSESVTGLAAADIAVTNGAATIAGSGSGTTYTLTITPDGTGNIGITIPAAAAMDGASNGNTASNTVTVTYDATVPTVELTGAPTTVNSTATFEVTATFSEGVTGLTAAEIEVTNGAVTIAGSGTIYTLTITPAGTDGEITITIPASVAADAASNGNTASDPVSVTYDATATTVELTGAPATVNNTATFEVTATFSESVTGLAATEIEVTNGAVTIAGSGTTYTLTITPAGTDGEITIIIPENVVVDTANNGNIASNEVTVTYMSDDTTAPTVALTGAPATVNSTATFEVTAMFSESVTGFDAVADITVTNGTAIAPVAVNNSETTYTLTITPDGMGNIGITIPAAAAVDAANNGNEVSNTVSVTYDTTRPLVTLTADITSVNNLDPFTVTATFSEAVTGFDMATDITVTHSMAAVPTPVGSSSTDYTLTITPAGTGTMTIFIPENVAMDEAGNGNTASTNAAGNTPSDPVTVTYDTTAPTVELSGAPDIASSLAPFTVTATFSEAVTFVPGAGIEVTNGAATLSGSGANYTLTITSDGTGDMSITFPADVAMDAAGNGNEASDTVSVAYDATAPTVTLTGPDTLSNLAPFEVTATFSEDVTGLEVAEIVVTNGAVTTLSGSGANYVLTMTPTGNGDLSITIPRDVAVDAAANGNTASSTLAVVNTIVADTKAAIAGFMLDRADKLARNQPGLTRFLQGTGCRGGLSANSTDISGSVAGCMSRGHTWGEISNTWSSDSTYTLATVGVHGFVRDNLIIGGLMQFDAVDDDRRNITGQGWLVGPYFVRQLTDQNMSFEGRLLTGQTDNDISPLGSYEDSFDTERYLGQLRITGRYRYRTATLMPLLDFTYTEDTQKAYTDTLGNLIDEQGVDLTQLTFGMDFSLPVAVQTGQLDLTGGLSGTYSEVNGGQSDVEGGRGRAELGLNYSRDNGTTLGAGIFYDGISSDHESFGANLSFDMKF